MTVAKRIEYYEAAISQQKYNAWYFGTKGMTSSVAATEKLIRKYETKVEQLKQKRTEKLKT